jgi:hypothetical protein
VDAHPTTPESLDLGARAWPLFSGAIIVGVLGLLAAILMGWFDHDQFRRFFHAYLNNFSFFLSIALGGLFFVLTQHVTHAGWSVNVRRVAELLAATMPVLAALSAPLIISIALNNGVLYPWAQTLPPEAIHAEGPAGHAAPQAAAPAEAAHAEAAHPSEAQAASAEGGEHVESDYKSTDEMLAELNPSKRLYLSPTFVIARVVLYFAAWSFIAVWYWRKSTGQDLSGDVNASVKMERWSGLSLVILGLTLTFAAFDLVMSLDPTWYSTMFGVYYFAGCALAIFATLVIVIMGLQRWGLLQAVTTEHYHDLGKYLFCFTFFWGYIAFSQYMLIWYANIPEETAWLRLRGASTVGVHFNQWTWVSIVLLFGQLLIPFAGLLSRHVKRNNGPLLFWAIWILVFHWIDNCWMIMPQYDSHFHLGPMQWATFFGIGGIMVATTVRLASRHALRPVRDPRVLESLGFENM